MKKPISSLAIGVCLLALCTGVAFADNLHTMSGVSGQSGSNVISSCGPANPPFIGQGFTPGNSGSAMMGSPFNENVAKKYAGNPGSPTTTNGANAHAVSQYDVACAQQQLHSVP